MQLARTFALVETMSPDQRSQALQALKGLCDLAATSPATAPLTSATALCVGAAPGRDGCGQGGRQGKEDQKLQAFRGFIEKLAEEGNGSQKGQDCIKVTVTFVEI